MDENTQAQQDAIRRARHEAEIERIQKHGIKTAELILAAEALLDDSAGIGTLGLHEALRQLNQHYDLTAERLGQEILKR